MTDDRIIDEIIAREGGYVDNFHDRGGCTKFGITIKTLGDWRARPVSCEDVKQLTHAEAVLIYRSLYLVRPRFDLIADARLRALVLDYAVHSGTKAAARALQSALGVTADGVIGPKTQNAIARIDAVSARSVYNTILRTRIEHLASVLQDDPSQRIFASGWFRRVASFV